MFIAVSLVHLLCLYILIHNLIIELIFLDALWPDICQISCVSDNVELPPALNHTNSVHFNTSALSEYLSCTFDDLLSVIFILLGNFLSFSTYRPIQIKQPAGITSLYIVKIPTVARWNLLSLSYIVTVNTYARCSTEPFGVDDRWPVNWPVQLRTASMSDSSILSNPYIKSMLTSCVVSIVLFYVRVVYVTPWGVCTARRTQLVQLHARRPSSDIEALAMLHQLPMWARVRALWLIVQRCFVLLCNSFLQ